jgi:predicted  nucleic acid-binding Zn-ribbon protein
MRPQDIKKKIAKLELDSIGDDEALEAYTESLNKAKENIKSYTTQVTTAERALKEANDSFNVAEKNVRNLEEAFDSDAVVKQQLAYEHLKKVAMALDVEMEDIGDSFSAADAQKIIDRLTAISKKGFDSLDESVNDTEKEFKEFSDKASAAAGKVSDALEDYTEKEIEAG